MGSRHASTRTHGVQVQAVGVVAHNAFEKGVAVLGGAEAGTHHTTYTPAPPSLSRHPFIEYDPTLEIIWLLHNLVEASFDLFGYLLLGDQRIPWELHDTTGTIYEQSVQALAQVPGLSAVCPFTGL